MVHGGVEGLLDRDLLTVGYALLAIFRDRELELVREVTAEIQRRGMLQRLVQTRVQTLLHRPGGSALAEAEARDIAEKWVLESSAWAGARSDSPAPLGRLPYGSGSYDGRPYEGVEDYGGSVELR